MKNLIFRKNKFAKNNCNADLKKFLFSSWKFIYIHINSSFSWIVKKISKIRNDQDKWNLSVFAGTLLDMYIRWQLTFINLPIS